MQEEEEQRVAVGGVFYPRAGCLLTPLIPIRAAGALIVTTHRVVFDPILHYKLFARKTEVKLEDIARADAEGSNVQFTLSDLVAVGKILTIRLKGGASHVFRSTQADELAEIINQMVGRRTG